MALHAGAKRKASTAVWYQGILDLHLLPVLGSRKMAGIRRIGVAKLHAGLTDHPAMAKWSLPSFPRSGTGPLRVTKSSKPAIRRGVSKLFLEKPKERYLSTEELARLGDALHRAGTSGLAWQVDKTKLTAKHMPKGARLTQLDSPSSACISHPIPLARDYAVALSPAQLIGISVPGHLQ